MKQRSITLVLAVGIVVAVATWVAGWWAIVPVALVAAVVWRDPRDAWLIGLGAAFGWAALLLVDARDGNLVHVASTLGGVFRVPGIVLLMLTPLFAALIAWSAAVVTHELRRLFASPRRAGPSVKG